MRWLRFEWLVAPRHAAWVRAGAAVGSAGGMLAFIVLLWWFGAWPWRSNPYDGEAFGYAAMLLGFPLSLFAVSFTPLGPTATLLSIGTSIVLSWGGPRWSRRWPRVDGLSPGPRQIGGA